MIKLFALAISGSFLTMRAKLTSLIIKQVHDDLMVIMTYEIKFYFNMYSSCSTQYCITLMLS